MCGQNRGLHFGYESKKIRNKEVKSTICECVFVVFPRKLEGRKGTEERLHSKEENRGALLCKINEEKGSNYLGILFFYFFFPFPLVQRPLCGTL